MQECTKRNVSTETKFRFHVFQDERFVDLNLYQYGWEQTEPLHSYGSYTKNPNPSPIEKRFGFSWFGAMEGTRTPGLLIRSQSLYPAELPTHTFRSEHDVFYH